MNTEERLGKLITNKGFDTFLNTLSARCEADAIDYLHKYNTDGLSLTVWLNFGNIPTTIQVTIDGLLSYTYFMGGIKTAEHFRNCSGEDFEMMNDRAFIYLRDGNASAHQEWYSRLEKA